MTSTLNAIFTPIRLYTQIAPAPGEHNEIKGDIPWVDFNAILMEILEPYPAAQTALLRALDKYHALPRDPLEAPPHGPQL
ncbi:MAG: hypothetical protein NTW28_38125 [Candidatus Solibacter sp.]|nr:hypothetical protein [Candidatus Solibacter sp.]